MDVTFNPDYNDVAMIEMEMDAYIWGYLDQFQAEQARQREADEARVAQSPVEPALGMTLEPSTPEEPKPRQETIGESWDRRTEKLIHRRRRRQEQRELRLRRQKPERRSSFMLPVLGIPDPGPVYKFAMKLSETLLPPYQSQLTATTMTTSPPDISPADQTRLPGTIYGMSILHRSPIAGSIWALGLRPKYHNSVMTLRKRYAGHEFTKSGAPKTAHDFAVVLLSCQRRGEKARYRIERLWGPTVEVKEDEDEEEEWEWEVVVEEEEEEEAEEIVDFEETFKLWVAENAQSHRGKGRRQASSQRSRPLPDLQLPDLLRGYSERVSRAADAYSALLSSLY
ncbi:hypothetical protein GGR53DRAFT_467479 [Hypoxylon sp. FL1150]|nr:hypothetical protein GGR53DRAFT_467479 [Hypoxylon sp. FL1150]